MYTENMNASRIQNRTHYNMIIAIAFTFSFYINFFSRSACIYTTFCLSSLVCMYTTSTYIEFRCMHDIELYALFSVYALVYYLTKGVLAWRESFQICTFVTNMSNETYLLKFHRNDINFCSTKIQ